MVKHVRGFANSIMVHGWPRHSQSQGSAKRANYDIENMLSTWMETNQATNWPEGLCFIQVMKNRAMHHGIKCSPQVVMFGHPMKAGLKTSNLPDNLVTNLNRGRT